MAWRDPMYLLSPNFPMEPSDINSTLIKTRKWAVAELTRLLTSPSSLLIYRNGGGKEKGALG